MIPPGEDHESHLPLIRTGVANLDSLVGGGIPTNSLNIVAGDPGSGKSILAQQILFHHVRANPDDSVLYITTLSEPAMKVIRYLQGFDFFDASLFGSRVHYRDIGEFLRAHSAEELLEHVMAIVGELRPRIVCVDSFKAIADLIPSEEKFRRFCYDLSVRLASATCTTLLVGEYAQADVSRGTEFAVADGIIHMHLGTRFGESMRLLNVRKMRGQAMAMGEFPYVISKGGIRVLVNRIDRASSPLEEEAAAPLPTGVPGLDGMMHGGMLAGRSYVIAGPTGSGKTTLGLQFLLEGARRGERGILYTFEETPDRLIELARGFGWNLKTYVENGTIRVVSKPVTDIRVDELLDTIIHDVRSSNPQRFVIDTFSMFAHRIEDPPARREKTSQFVQLMQETDTAALILIEMRTPEDMPRIASLETTLADGAILLTTDLVAERRVRHLEVYKVKGAAHARGRQRMEIAAQGIRVFYKSPEAPLDAVVPEPITFSPVAPLIRGSVPYNNHWLLRGGPAVGKSVWALQFAADRLQSGESVLFLATESPSATILTAIENLGILTEPYVESGQLVVKSAYEENELDIDDVDSFLITLSRWVDRLDKPCAVIVDSLAPIMLGMSAEGLKTFLTKRRQLVARPDVTVFDTSLAHEDILQTYLTNHYDVVIDLFIPDWGDLHAASQGSRPVVRIIKARGAPVDTRPYPFRITREGAVAVQNEFYESRGDRAP